MENKIFCYAPWNNIELFTNGKILPCCKFQDKYYSRQYNINTDSLEDYRQSDLVKKIKNDFLTDQWPAGCERCRIEEDAGIPSRRQMDYQRWQQHYDVYDINSNELLTVGIALGNVCNLKCIICQPMNSSLWRKEYRDLYKIDVIIPEKSQKNFITSLPNIAPNLLHLDIHGGEPFLAAIDEHQALLDHYIETKQSKEMTIHYTTNGIIWPDESWFDRWQNFAKIDMQLSIDGVGKKFEYLRYPGRWDVMTANVDRYLDKQQQNPWLTLSVSHTVSSFNIYYLEEFRAWCHQVGLPKPWMGKVYNPRHLRPTVWPEQIKQRIVDKLGESQHPDILSWINVLANSDDSEFFQDFLEYMNRHDAYRGLSYKQTFPEMSEFL